MPTLAELIQTLPDDSRDLFRTEVKKFEKYLNIDIKSLTGEQLSSLLATLSTEKNSLSVKIIQFETQLEEKQKELEKQTKEILEKYGITDMSELETKKAEIEQELETQINSLRELISTIKE